MLYWGRVIQIPGSPCGFVFSFKSMICDEEGADGTVGTALTKRTTCCTSFNSLSILSYNSTCFSSYLCNMSSEASSISPWTRLMSSSVRVASNYGLLACIFFLAEGFFGVTFFFGGVTVTIGGSSGDGVLAPANGDLASPPPFSYSPSSPPPYPFASSSPSLSDLDPLSPEVSSSSSSSLSMSWTSTCFLHFLCFFIPLDCTTCSARVTFRLHIVSTSDKSASMTGTRNAFGQSFIIYSISASVSL
jgi:hypothetical protein